MIYDDLPIKSPGGSSRPPIHGSCCRSCPCTSKCHRPHASRSPVRSQHERELYSYYLAITTATIWYSHKQQKGPCIQEESFTSDPTSVRFRHIEIGQPQVPCRSTVLAAEGAHVAGALLDLVALDDLPTLKLQGEINKETQQKPRFESPLQFKMLQIEHSPVAGS